MSARPADSSIRRGAVCVALAAVVFCSRAWLVQVWGSPVPFWDQWDAEALGLYRPWLDGTWHWQDLFRAHNEHRIALTRIADLALFVGLGNWNVWAQLLLNAALHAATAAGLARLFWPTLTTWPRVVLVAGLGGLFTATSGWQNALWGFQSQVYFGNLLAVVALACLIGSEAFSRRWWFGWSASLLALFANASGVFVAIVALGVTIAAPDRARRWPASLAFVAIAALGFFLRVEPPQHAALQAQSLGQFVAVFSHCLAWPFVDQGSWCLALQLPLIVLALVRWRTRTSFDPVERAALALGLLAVLHAAAVAYSRGAGLIDARPLSRYQDPLLLGVAAQFFAALRLASRGHVSGRLGAIGWCAAICCGLLALTETNLTLNLPFKRAQDRASLVQVRTYVATHDASIFTRDPEFAGPHPNPKVVQRVLDDPLLRPVLSPAFLLPTANPTSGARPWIIEHAGWLTLAAALGLAGTLAWPTRRS